MLFNERGNFEGGVPSHIVEVSTDHDEEVYRHLKSQVKKKERKVSEEQVAVDAYIDQLVEKIKHATKQKDKILLIKEMVQDGDVFRIEAVEDQPTNVILEKLLPQLNVQRYADLSTEEVGAYEDRIEEMRKKIIKQLQKRLAHDPELSSLTSQNILQKDYSLAGAGRITKTTTLEGKNFVVRNDRFEEMVGKRNEDVELHKQAMKKLITLPKHENILNYHSYSPEDQKGIVDELDLHNLYELIDNPQSSVVDMLDVVHDCMEGALFLEKNGLILQDISPNNLGFTPDQKKGRKGILFDLEGLYVRGAQRTNRFTNLGISSENKTGIPDYFPPEAYKYQKVKVPDSEEVKYEFIPVPVMGSEMTYQFGLCIKEIMQSDSFKELLVQLNEKNRTLRGLLSLNKLKSDELKKEINDLVRDMIVYSKSEPDPLKKRISLSKAKDRVEQIMEKLQKALA
jgi:serine/threonine protein kinase